MGIPYLTYKVKVELHKYEDDDNELTWGCEVWETYYSGETLVKLRPNLALTADMSDWSKTQGGRFVGFNLYEFTNQESATLFVLRWHES